VGLTNELVDRLYAALGAGDSTTLAEVLAPGLMMPLPQITEEDKRKILGENYARMAGLDIGQLHAEMRDDEFASSADLREAAPYSTTKFIDAPSMVLA
jgi:hypothetical protein